MGPESVPIRGIGDIGTGFGSVSEDRPTLAQVGHETPGVVGAP